MSDLTSHILGAKKTESYSFPDKHMISQSLNPPRDMIQFNCLPSAKKSSKEYDFVRELFNIWMSNSRIFVAIGMSA